MLTLNKPGIRQLAFNRSDLWNIVGCDGSFPDI